MTKKLEPTPQKVPAELLLRHSTPAQSWQLGNAQPILRVGSMSPYRPTRREFLIGAGSLLVLAPYGCGSNGESGAGGEATSSGTRTIKHELGETRVPRKPRRIVALDFAVIPDCLLALDRIPIGATPLDDQSGYPFWLKGEMGGVETVGFGGEANLEKVATLNPGLILGYDYHEDIYDELSQMAPTVALSGITEDWKEPFRKVARAVGEQQRAERVIEEYFARLDNFKQEMGERLDRITVSFVTLREDHIRLYGEGSFPGELLQEAGLKMSPQPDIESELGKMTDGRIVDISRELIPQIEGDIIFFTSYGVSESQVADFRQDPLWQRLEAVREDRVYPVDPTVWSNSGPLGVERAVDDLFEYLVPA